MKPSKRMRQFYLLTIKENLYKILFVAIGILTSIIGLFVLLFTDNKLVGWVFIGIGIATSIFIYFLLYIVNIILNIRLNDYPVSKIKKTKQEVLDEALKLNDNPDNKLLYEVNDNWIDVSYNWKKSLSINFNGIIKDQCIYKKLIRINNNYTYDELDYEVTGTIDISLQKIILSKHFFCGRMMQHEIVYEFGDDLSNNNIGINSFTLDTRDITNQVHEFLANCGYKLRK